MLPVIEKDLRPGQDQRRTHQGQRVTSDPKRGQAPGQPRLGRHLGHEQQLLQSDRAPGVNRFTKKSIRKNAGECHGYIPDEGNKLGEVGVELLILNARRLILLSHSQNIILPVSDSFNVIETLGIFYKCPWKEISFLSKFALLSWRHIHWRHFASTTFSLTLTQDRVPNQGPGQGHPQTSTSDLSALPWSSVKVRQGSSIMTHPRQASKKITTARAAKQYI